MQHNQQIKQKETNISVMKLKEYSFFIKKILQSTNIEFDDLKGEEDLDVLL